MRCFLDRDEGSGSVHVAIVELLRVASTREDGNDDEGDDDDNGWNAERRSTTARQAAVAKTVAAAVPRPNMADYYLAPSMNERRAPAPPAAASQSMPGRTEKLNFFALTLHKCLLCTELLT